MRKSQVADVLVPMAALWLFATTGLVLGQTGSGLSVRFGIAPPPPLSLVQHDESWHYRRDINSPQTNWQTVADSGLDATWLQAQGGFGFGDSGIVGENTTVSVLNQCTTLYIRRTFTLSEDISPATPLYLKVDYDDGFVAYLDGEELTRANLTNGPGTFVSNEATTGGTSHEGSCCNSPTHPAEVFSLGAAGNRLAAGEHVLAIIAVNQAISSSDLHIIPDLYLGAEISTDVQGAFFTITATNFIEISGTNAVVGATRLMINGDEVPYNSGANLWQLPVPLAPGVNQLTVQALDDAGHILAATNRTVIADLGGISVGGNLAETTVWRAADGLVRLTNSVVVPSGGSLTIEAGVVVLASAGSKLYATNAAVTAAGTEAQNVYFLPADGTATNWGGLIVSGTNGILQLQHTEILGGFVQALDGVNASLEDCYLHDYQVASPPIVSAVGTPNPVVMSLRRCLVSRYHEMLLRLSTNYLEGCLLEYQDYSGDGIDFDGGRPGSFIRRCTLRRGNIYNTDALDIGEYSAAEPSRGVLIEGCLLHDFIDKGISMGINAQVTVSNCVIFNVESGIAVKDLSEAGIYNTTIAAANYGFNNYNKANSSAPDGGGFITNSFNNILWDIRTASVAMKNGSTLTADYSDFQRTNWPGAGNVDLDPMFVDAATHNYRLATNSPLLAAGANGTAMGAAYPVGGLPPAPMNLAALVLTNTGITLTWEDDADNEDGFEIQCSPDRLLWQTIGATAANVLAYADETAPANRQLYYRVRATNDIAASRWSILAGASLLASPSVAATGLGTNGWFGLRLEAPVNRTVLLEASDDLREWSPVLTNRSSGGWLNLYDPAGINEPQKFYRIQLSK